MRGDNCMPLLVMLFVLKFHRCNTTAEKSPLFVITTWNLSNASEAAWKVLRGNGTAIDAVVEGCSYCEVNQCRMTVGYGGSPSESGETTLDALIMDGTTMDVGAVGDLREIKEAITVARHVLYNTEHSLVVGDAATEFAVSMGFKRTSLSTNYSLNMWKNWISNNCQPNFWKEVTPNPKLFCGPYKPTERCEDELCAKTLKHSSQRSNLDKDSHDTIGMVAMDMNGNIAAGTSTNGLVFKIAGRVGDSPIPGSGGYADTEVGGAAATGNGDIIMRFMPSFHAVELIRSGMSPAKATEKVVKRISRFYPHFFGAVIAMSAQGDFGAACHGYDYFPYTARASSFEEVKSFNITCI